jgi:hypothetical protein
MKNLSVLFSLIVTIGSFSNSAFAAPCDVTDVQAYNSNGSSLVSASACVNKSGNDGNGSTFTTEINSDLGTTGEWIQLIKSDDPGSSLTVIGDGTGSWDASSIAVQITNPYVIVLKAANAFAAYLFEIDTNGVGTFSTIGVNDKIKDISHISLYVKDISPVPVPAAAWLMAPVFAGFMLRKRKA